MLYLLDHGLGKADTLAQALARTLERTGTPQQRAGTQRSTVSIDTATIHRMLNLPLRGSGNSGSVTAKLVGDTVRMGGVSVPPGLGVGSPINFPEVTVDRQVTTGDLA